VPTGDPWYGVTAVESYRRIHAWLQAAFSRLGVETELAPSPLKTAAGQCFVGYEQSDLLWRGRKIAGAAQRRRRDGLLIQGSVQPPPVPVTRGEWQRAMAAAGSAGQKIEWISTSPDEGLIARVRELVKRKYSQASYNQRR
jgi:lipoate-protein ligase A